MLTDRLVSEAVLATILKHIEVPRRSLGNMEAAQQEIMVMAFEIRRGKTVVRVSSNLILIPQTKTLRSCGIERLLVLAGIRIALNQAVFVSTR